jgi:hypothetical protein
MRKLCLSVIVEIAGDRNGEVPFSEYASRTAVTWKVAAGRGPRMSLVSRIANAHPAERIMSSRILVRRSGLGIGGATNHR